MTDRFVQFTALIEQFYKYIIKIKAFHMKDFGLKASHVMCLFYIGKHEQGVTASELCVLCMEDKAGISKALSELKAAGMIDGAADSGAKNYRQRYWLTDSGREVHKQVERYINEAVAACGCDFTEEESTFFYDSLEHIVSSVIVYYNALKTNGIAKGDQK